MPKLLVVDDEEDMRATLAILLEAEGYGVVTATNGHGAANGKSHIPSEVNGSGPIPLNSAQPRQLEALSREHGWSLDDTVARALKDRLSAIRSRS